MEGACAVFGLSPLVLGSSEIFCALRGIPIIWLDLLQRFGMLKNINSMLCSICPPVWTVVQTDGRPRLLEPRQAAPRAL